MSIAIVSSSLNDFLKEAQPCLIAAIENRYLNGIKCNFQAITHENVKLLSVNLIYVENCKDWPTPSLNNKYPLVNCQRGLFKFQTLMIGLVNS